MPLGDSRFPGVLADFDRLLAMHGIMVTITRYNNSKIGTRDIDGKPLTDIYGHTYKPDTVSANILVSDEYLDDRTEIAGFKPRVILQILAKPGVIVELDEIPYGGHVFKVESVSQTLIGGNEALEMCRAVREVSV